MPANCGWGGGRGLAARAPYFANGSAKSLREVVDFYDRRFDMKNVIEEYAETRHDWPNASQCLIRAFYRLVTNPMDSESSRKLRAALKVGDQLLR